MKEGRRDVLVFYLLENEVALDISCVREILKPREIHPLLHAPDFVEGIINLRGSIIAVFDLRKKFGFKAGGEDRQNARIIVCRIRNILVGLIVDGVSEVLSVPEGDISPTPQVISMQIKDSYVSGVARLGERLITLLDLESVITEQETRKLSKTRIDKGKAPA